MPFWISKDKGWDTPENVKKMESCILSVQKDNPSYSKEKAIRICKSQLFWDQKIEASEMIDIFWSEFAEETKLRKNVAQIIIKMLAKKAEENDIVKIEDFQDVLRRLKEKIQRSIDFTKLLNKIKESEVEEVIDEMIKQKEMWRAKERGFSEKSWSVRFFESLEFEEKVLKAGDIVDIQIMRVWKWDHPAYWEVKVTSKTISDVISNFNSRQRWIDLAVDENHEPNHKALWWFKDLYTKGKNNLFAKIELTKRGAELINEGAYKYFSPELIFSKIDEESWKSIKNLLIGWAFTNRPFFKSMKSLMASEVCEESRDDKWNDHNAILFFNDLEMNKFLRLLAQFSQLEQFSADKVEELKAAFSEIKEEEKTPELESAFNEAMEKAETTESEEKDESKTEEETTSKEEEKTGEEETKSDEWSDEKTEPVIKANEDWTKIVQMSEADYLALNKNADLGKKLQKEAKFNEVKNKVDWLVFSEDNKIWVALPKEKDRITKFAAGLSESQMAEFFSIMEWLKTVAASEIGANGEPAQEYNSEEIDFMMNKMGFSEEEAKNALKA